MPLPFLVNPASSTPIFRQIADGLRGAIARGTMAPGTLIPSVRAIAEELGVNPTTVHKAVAELERDGMVQPERGRGMVVRQGTRSQARASGEEALAELLVQAVRLAVDTGVTPDRFDTLLRKARRQHAPVAQGAADDDR